MPVTKKKTKPAKKPMVKIKIEKRAAVLYARVKPSTKEFFDMQAVKSGANNVGEYLDALAKELQERL